MQRNWNTTNTLYLCNNIYDLDKKIFAALEKYARFFNIEKNDNNKLKNEIFLLY